MNFHTVFKENRKKLGYTQEDIATYLNVTPQAVSKWETGQGTPDLALIVPIAQLFNVTTDELLGNVKDAVLIDEEISEIRAENCDLKSKYEAYTKLLKQSPWNIEILRSCITCACSLIQRKDKYSLDSEKIDQLLADMERYRNALKKSDVAKYNELATGKLAQAYIFSEKFDKAKEIIKDSTIFQFYNQDRLNGHLYYHGMHDNKKARENYAISLSSSFNWMLEDIKNIGCTYANFFGKNEDGYDEHKITKAYKTVYDIIRVFCSPEFPYPYHYSYLNACEFLAQGCTDIGDYDMALNYLSEFVSVAEEWKRLSGTKPIVEDYCFMLSACPSELTTKVASIPKNYIQTVFNRNKYKRYDDNPVFVSLKKRAEELTK